MILSKRVCAAVVAMSSLSAPVLGLAQHEDGGTSAFSVNFLQKEKMQECGASSCGDPTGGGGQPQQQQKFFHYTCTNGTPWKGGKMGTHAWDHCWKCNRGYEIAKDWRGYNRCEKWPPAAR